MTKHLNLARYAVLATLLMDYGVTRVLQENVTHFWNETKRMSSAHLKEAARPETFPCLAHCVQLAAFLLALFPAMDACAALPNLAGLPGRSRLSWWGGMPAAVLGAVISGVVIGWCRERYRIVRAETAQQERIAILESEQQALRTKGDESERHVGTTLLGWARELDSGATLQTGVILRYQDSRPDQISKFEIDCLLITRFGIFVVEVKNWKHPVLLMASGWVVDKPSGPEEVKSPLLQNQPKQRALQALADAIGLNGQRVKVRNLVILPHPEARLAMQAPAEAMYLNEGRLYLRQAYCEAQKTGLCSAGQLERITARLRLQIDDTPLAKHDFLLELFEKKRLAVEYKTLDQERLMLVNAPPEIPRAVWKCGVTYLPLILLASWTWIASHAPMRHPGSTPAALPAISVGSKAASRPPPMHTKAVKH